MNNIRSLIKMRGASQKEFALEIGVSQPTVSDWVHNKKDPSGENLQKIADYFGVSPENVKTQNAQEDSAAEISLMRTTKNSPELYGYPQTHEAKILSAGIDRMPAVDRQKALQMVKLMFSQYDEYFAEGGDDVDTEP